jgi:hypothetical protein
MESDHDLAQTRVNVGVMTALEFKMYASQDKPVLEEFLRRVWKTSADEWLSHRPKTDAVTLLVLQDGRLLGMMTRFERWFHPHTTTFEVGIDPEKDGDLRQQLENTLFDQITRDVARDRVFRLQLLETQTQEMMFVRSKQFIEMRRTWMPTVPISGLAKNLFKNSLKSSLKRGYLICNLNELQHDPAFMQQLTEANRDHYIATHQINPPHECALDQWYKIAFGEDWLPEASFVALKNDQIAAFSNLCISDSEDTCDVAWFASTPANMTDSLMLNQSLKAKELEYARTHAIANLCFEFDSTDPQAMALLETLPLDRGLALITYQTGIPTI